MYFDCEPSTQSYASLVFLGMHASRKVQSRQKVSHLLEFLLPILLGKVSCVPNTTRGELYGVKVGKDWRETHGAVMHFPKDEHAFHFLVFLPGCTLYRIVYSGGFFRI